MQGNRSRDSRAEVAVRSALHRSGLRFRKHARPLPDLECEADAVFRPERVAVFIDGCFWHGCPEHGRRPSGNAPYWHAKLGRNVARDRRNDSLLHEAGWVVLRAWEHEDPTAVAERVRAVVVDRRAQRG